MTKITGKTNDKEQWKEVSVKELTSGAVGLCVSLEDTDIIVNTDEINVSAFNDTNGSATNATVFADGVDLSAVTEAWQGIGGYDSSSDVFRAFRVDSQGQLKTYGGASSTLSANYKSPQDFSVAFGTTNSLNVTGAPFTVDDTECTIVYTFYKPSGGTWSSPIINGSSGVSLSASSGTVTVSGSDATFASGDSYVMGIQYQEKGYASPNDAQQVLELSPITENYVGETLVDTSDFGTTTSYYYVDMAGYQKSSYQIELDSPSGTLTATFEGSLQDDGTSASSCAYQDITNDIFGVASVQANGGTKNDMLIDDTSATGGLKYGRIKVVGAAASGTVTVYHKRWY